MATLTKVPHVGSDQEKDLLATVVSDEQAKIHGIELAAEEQALAALGMGKKNTPSPRRIVFNEPDRQGEYAGDRGIIENPDDGGAAAAQQQQEQQLYRPPQPMVSAFIEKQQGGEEDVAEDMDNQGELADDDFPPAPAVE